MFACLSGDLWKQHPIRKRACTIANAGLVWCFEKKWKMYLLRQVIYVYSVN